MTNRLDMYTNIAPDARQLRIQEMGFYGFIHFGMNTFTNAEWGTGQVPADTFNPTNLDTDQWAEAFAVAGMKAIVLTCKHHDGFCLWQSDLTDYCLKSSPYKNGNGDIVKDLSESCKKYGLEFGIYLSPWDRNCAFYGKEPQKYNDFYIAQLTELLTRYGKIFSVWLDGACGSWMDGVPKQVYDFERIYRTVRELQPDAIISNCGPDVRWIGNEAGITRPSEWNVLPKFSVSIQKVEQNSQQSEADAKKLKTNCTSEDLGSRALLAQFDEFMWYPGEVDVSIRPGWFYHPAEDSKVRSIDNLLNIYCNSVGGNAMLLLNVPPNREGRIAEPDVARLKELGERIKSAFKFPVAVKKVEFEDANNKDEIDSIQEGTPLWFTSVSAPYSVRLVFQNEDLVDKFVIQEDIRKSQRIERFTIFTVSGSRKKVVYRGTTIGGKKIVWLKKAVRADSAVLVVDECRKTPFIRSFTAYRTDGTNYKRPMFDRIIRFFHRINYAVYCAMQNIGKNKNKQD